jgi:hypothetical protein
LLQVGNLDKISKGGITSGINASVRRSFESTLSFSYPILVFRHALLLSRPLLPPAQEPLLPHLSPGGSRVHAQGRHVHRLPHRGLRGNHANSRGTNGTNKQNQAGKMRFSNEPVFWGNFLGNFSKKHYFFSSLLSDFFAMGY